MSPPTHTQKDMQAASRNDTPLERVETSPIHQHGWLEHYNGLVSVLLPSAGLRILPTMRASALCTVYDIAPQMTSTAGRRPK